MLGKKTTSNNTFKDSALVNVAVANKGSNHYIKGNENSRVWCDYCNKSRHALETYLKLHWNRANWKSNKPDEHSSDNHVTRSSNANTVDS